MVVINIIIPFIKAIITIIIIITTKITIVNTVIIKKIITIFTIRRLVMTW